MKRRQFLKKTGLGVSGLVCSSMLRCNTAKNKEPNVLFIIIEDLSTNLGCYGKSYIKTPNIDKLAQRGIRFDRAYANYPVCAASRASFFTGLRPPTTGVEYPYSEYFVNEVRPNHYTLAQYFFENGYYTRNINKIHHGRDLDEISEPLWASSAPTYVSAENKAKLASGVPKTELLPYEMADVPDDQYGDGQTADKVTKELRKLSVQQKPFFFAVGFGAPHLPFAAPKKYWDMYKREEIPLAENRSRPKGSPDMAYNRYNLKQYRWEHADPQKQFSEDYERLLRHGYFASISYTDAQIGKVLDTLQEIGEMDNTIIALIADHGFHIGEVNNWGKTTMFEESLHVPMIISAPGISKPGSHTTGIVELVDITPTFIDLAGFKVPTDMEGISAKPLIKKPARSWKKAAFSRAHRDMICRKMGVSMRTERYRYTEWQDTLLETVLERELYDMQNDPYETVNIANSPANKALVDSLSAQLKAGWKEALPDGIENHSNNPLAPPPYAWGPEGVSRRQAWHQEYGGSEDMGWKAATELRLKKDREKKNGGEQ